MRPIVFCAVFLLASSTASAQPRDAGRGARDAGVRDAGSPPRDAGSAEVVRARTLFEQGQAAYAAGRFDEASAKMVEAYELTRAPDLAFNAASIFERMSDYANALRYFEIYLRDGSPTPEERSATEARVAAIRAADERRRNQVYTVPASDDELTNEARTFFLRGVAMFRRRQYSAAQTAFLAAYRFAPLPEVIFNLAVTSERLDARQDAIDYYREYLRATPNGPDRGDVEARIRRLREAGR